MVELSLFHFASPGNGTRRVAGSALRSEHSQSPLTETLHKCAYKPEAPTMTVKSNAAKLQCTPVCRTGLDKAGNVTCNDNRAVIDDQPWITKAWDTRSPCDCQA
eukprot:265237-Amphidinium_carterae.1